MYKPICLKLFRHVALCALDLARLKTGSSNAARIPMMAMTTSNSIRVKARFWFIRSLFWHREFLSWQFDRVRLISFRVHQFQAHLRSGRATDIAGAYISAHAGGGNAI